jgi:hypothetical protein
MGEAFLWGVLGWSSLVLGGAIARRVSLTARHVGLIMAFGAGVLGSAVAYALGDLPGAWQEVPESHMGIVQAGDDELRPFSPRSSG